MHVRDVMTRHPITVPSDTPLKRVVTTLLDHDVSALPVVGDRGRLLGIVSESDVMSKEAYGPGRRRPLQLVAHYLSGRDPGWLRRASGITAGDVMSRRVVVVHPSTDVRHAARLMLERQVKRLVVMEEERVVGIVTRADVLRLFTVPDADVEREMEALLSDVCRVPEHLDVDYVVRDGVVRLDGLVAHPSDRSVVEHAVAGLPGVMAVDNHLDAREPEPRAVG